MANELSVTASLTYTPSITNQVKVEPPTFSKDITVSGDSYVSGVQAASSTEAVLSHPALLATHGVCMIKNLDDTNSVQYGGVQTATDGDRCPLKLNPGEFALFRANEDIYIYAASGTPEVQYWLFEA